MSYQDAARRAYGTSMSSRLEDEYEERYIGASAAIEKQIQKALKDPDMLAKLLAAVQEYALEQPDDPGNLLNEFPLLKLNFHLGRARLRATQHQLAYGVRDMEPDEFFVNSDVQEADLC